MPLAAVFSGRSPPFSASSPLGTLASLALLVLDGWCTFLWLRDHVRHAVAAWIGGLMMVLGPFAAARAHGHLNLLFFFPVPLLFIEIERFVE